MTGIRHRFNSVRGRLAFLVGALTLASLLAALVLVLRAYQQENSAVSRQLQSTARALAIGVDLHVRQQIQLLNALAVSPDLQAGDLVAFEQMVRSIALPPDVSLSLVDDRGMQLFNTDPRPAAPSSALVTSNELASVIRRGEPYISNVKIGPSGRPLLFIARPVIGSSYVLCASYDPESFSRNLSLLRMAGKNLIVVVDRVGTVAARSRMPEKYIGQRATPSFWKSLSATPEGAMTSVTLDGVRVLTVFKRSDLSGWTIINSAPLDEAYASMRRLLLVSGLISGLLLCISMLLARWIGRGLVNAVNRVVTLATAIGRGVSPSFCFTGLAETDSVARALCSAGDRLLARERELREFNHSLEHRISARTSQLISTNRELAATNRELQEFARVAAHDLREPLRTISAFSSTLTEDFRDLPPLARSYTDRISAAAQRMHRLLESIFTYSRVASAPRVEQIVDLTETAREVREDLEARFKETGGKIHFDALATVSGDPRELHQLLLNLVANALKFHREGVPPVVELETIEDDRHIRLVVRDNGVGFDPNLAEQLFVPFRRLENSRGFEGTGMGLAIVRRIAERHAGEVRAWSTPGQGSRFEVTFPAVRKATQFVNVRAQV